MPLSRQFLLLLNQINKNLHRGLVLDVIARQAGQSKFQLHREFRRTAGETLKQFTLRLQLERAAAQLAATSDDIRSVALANGFASHEVFVRAFRRRFEMPPTSYRKIALRGATRAQRRRHFKLTTSIGPCIRFFHRPRYKYFGPKNSTQSHISMPTLSITRKEIPPQHILFIRRRIAPSDMQQTLGECFGKLFTHAAKAGLPIAGWPMCRYVSTGLGLWTIDPAIPLAAPAAAEGEMQPDVLRGGWVALGIHAGPYDQLPDTNAAIEKWIEANGYKATGIAWEHYVTDPGEHPDPKDWRTEVYWPLEE